MTTLRTSAERGYHEAQRRLDDELGDKIVYHTPPLSFWDRHSDSILVDIEVDDFYYESEIKINGNTVSTGIVIPKVNTNINPQSDVAMIDRTNGVQYELTVDPEWTDDERDNEVQYFVRQAYWEYISDAMQFTDRIEDYEAVHRTVLKGIHEARVHTAQASGPLFHIYDFATRDTGGKLQFTWETRLVDDNESHNMCVEYDKKTNITRTIAEHRDVDGCLVRHFNANKYIISSRYEGITHGQRQLRENLRGMFDTILEEHFTKQKEQGEDLINDLTQDEHTL